MNERNGLNEPRNQVKGWDTNGCVWEQQPARLKEPRARNCSRVFTRKKDTKRFILSWRVFSFGSRRSSVPPERMHYFSLRRCGSIMFVSFIQKALCGRHSFREHCDATRCDWLSFVQLKSLCHRTRSLLNASASGDVQSQAR